MYYELGIAAVPESTISKSTGKIRVELAMGKRIEIRPINCCSIVPVVNSVISERSGEVIRGPRGETPTERRGGAAAASCRGRGSD